MADLQDFISEYDDGSLQFNGISFRKGAKITDHFGLSEGFELDESNDMVWGLVRLHTGVDRSGGGIFRGQKDPVISPFNFERSAFVDLRGKVYGTQVFLYNDKYNFYLMIGHMYPEEVKILDDLKQGKAVTKDTLIGPAGSDGESTGRHTHTEIISINDSSEVLEALLHKKFNDEVDKEYDSNDIFQFYHLQEKFKTSSDQDILVDWTKQKKIRNASFSNKFLYRYKDVSGNKKTRYNSELLFNGL